MSSSARRRLAGHKPPRGVGWEDIEHVIEDFEQQMKDAVAEDEEGVRKNELAWRVHRVHYEKNRFVWELMYKRKKMKRELYEYLTREKVVDAALISKWRKPGYENLCSMLTIQKGSTNFGTTSLCRVPIRQRAPQAQLSPCVQTGCISCFSGDGKDGPIWWNTPLEDEDYERLGMNKNKRKAKVNALDDDDVPEEVKKRLRNLM